MTQVQFGPVNITSGNSANFVVEFLNSAGVITVPSSATLTVTYTNTSNVSQSDNVSLTLTGSFWNGTWSSTSAAYGLATWTLLGSGSTTVAQTGQIKVIYP
jgi:hypothetical protein